MGIFFPEAIPYSMLPLLGDFLYYLNYSHQPPIIRGLYAVVLAIHSVEAIYAYILARLVNLPISCCSIYCQNAPDI